MSTETMKHTNSPLAHQFDDLPQQREAADMGMWLFLCTELMFFGGLFLAYTIYRTRHEETFELASRQLELGWGAFNTAILLTSSLTVVLATVAAESNQRKSLIQYLTATIVLGIVFILIKLMEYHHKYQHGLMPLGGLPFHWDGPARNEAELFFDLYFLMTGIHLLHMVIGLGLMGVLLVQSLRGGLLGEYSAPVRITGLYWHFVDVVWVFLFPLLYLVGIR